MPGLPGVHFLPWRLEPAVLFCSAAVECSSHSERVHCTPRVACDVPCDACALRAVRPSAPRCDVACSWRYSVPLQMISFWYLPFHGDRLRAPSVTCSVIPCLPAVSTISCSVSAILFYSILHFCSVVLRYHFCGGGLETFCSSLF